MTVPKRFQRYGVKYAILQEQEVDWQAHTANSEVARGQTYLREGVERLR